MYFVSLKFTFFPVRSKPLKGVLSFRNSVEGIVEGDDVVDCITLYNLKDLPAILETCSCAEDLIMAVNDLVQNMPEL